MRIETPSERSRSMSAHSSWRTCGSRPTVGSSSSSSRGRCRRARAMSRRRRMPPLSASTFASRRSRRLARPSARSIASWRSRVGTRYRCAKTRRFCSVVSETSRLSSCGTTPISARACLESSGSRWPRTSSSPSSQMTCAVSAFIVVDLPAPLGPSRPTHLPNGTSRSSPSTAVIAERPVPTPKRLTTLRRRIAESMAIQSYDRRGRPESSLLAVEVLDARRARREQVLALVAGPDADLVAVRVRGRRREDDGGPHEQARGLLGLVEQLVRALGALREEDDVEGREPLGALRRAQRRRALEDERPLLLGVLVVVRTQRLAGRQLIDAGPGVLRPQALAEAAHARAEPLGVLGVVGELRVGDADAPHGRIVSRCDHAL